jgi:hypothetical protein
MTIGSLHQDIEAWLSGQRAASPQATGQDSTRMPGTSQQPHESLGAGDANGEQAASEGEPSKLGDLRVGGQGIDQQADQAHDDGKGGDEHRPKLPTPGELSMSEFDPEEDAPSDVWSKEADDE